MLGILQKVQEQLVTRIGTFLQQNIFKSIGTTVAFTICLVLVLLNPWFGSSAAKTLLIEFMVDDKDDLVPIVNGLKNDAEFSTIFNEGMRESGYFEAGNAGIMEEWHKRWTAHYRTDESKATDTKEAAAILDARRRARNWSPPFEPGGIMMNVGRPSCASDQPHSTNVMISSNSDVFETAALQVGDRVRIQRRDRKGGYVVAYVQRADIQGIDAWLNAAHFDDTLEIRTKAASVYVVKTAEDLTPVRGGDGRKDYPDCG